MRLLCPILKIKDEKKRQPTATCVGIFEILCKMKKTVRKKLLRILTPEVLWLKHKCQYRK